MTVVILEGPDGVGKTTLLNDPLFFPELFPFHLGPPSITPPLREYIEAVDRYPDVKFDRLHLGERIYGPIFRGVDRLGAVGQRMVERVLLSRSAVTVLCLTPYSVAFENWRERKEAKGELVTDEATYERIYYAYADLLMHVDQAELPTIHYDYTKADSLLLAAEYARQMSTLFKNNGPGIGRFKPGVTLLVGDTINQHVGINNHQFVAESGSSVWLTQQLIDWGVKERDLYWINQSNVNWLKAWQWVEELQPSRIIALGNTAQLWCQKAGFTTYVHVPHPAFWKRFHSAEPYVLREYFL